MKSNGPVQRPGESDRPQTLEQVKRYLNQLIDGGDFSTARDVLRRVMQRVTDDAATMAWCRDAAIRIQTRSKDSDNQRRLIQTAQKLIDVHDYQQAQSLLASVRPVERSPALAALLAEIDQTVAELAELEQDLIHAVRRDDLEEIKAIVDRLLELRPWDELAHVIKDNLGKLRQGRARLEIDSIGTVQYHEDRSLTLSANAWGIAALALIVLVFTPMVWFWKPSIHEPPPGTFANPAPLAPVAGKELQRGFAVLQQNFIDPLKGTEFVVAQDSATIKVSGAIHGLSIELGHMTAPRALEPVAGDFDYEVRVSKITGPQGPSLEATRRAFVGAGILLMFDDRNYIRLERAALQANGQNMLYASWEQRIDGKATRMGGTREKPLQADATWLRVQRRGNQLTGSVSEDGTNWHTFPPLTINWPQEIQVGIAAVNNTPVGFEAVFDNRALTKL